MMAGTLSFGIKYAKRLNAFLIILSILVILATLYGHFVVMPRFDLINAQIGEEVLELNTPPGVSLSFFFLRKLSVPYAIFSFIVLILLARINQGLSSFKQEARIAQIVLSFLFMFEFPIGTLLYGISFYFMLFDKKTKDSFLS